MPTLTVRHTDERDRTYYEPVIGRVQGVSLYNDNQFRIEGLDGFWQYDHDPGLTVGSTYKMALTTKPKSGPSAKPGSAYQDIVRAELSDQAPDAARDQSANDAQPAAAGGSPAAPAQYGSTTDERIKRAQVYNNTALVLAAMIQQPKDALHPVPAEKVRATWARYDHLSKLFWTGTPPAAQPPAQPAEQPNTADEPPEAVRPPEAPPAAEYTPPEEPVEDWDALEREVRG
jgi:hypothetical protein